MQSIMKTLVQKQSKKRLYSAKGIIKNFIGAGKMAKLLRVLVLVDNPCSLLNGYMWAQNNPSL